MRKKRLIYNGISSLASQFSTVICGFILPRIILSYYGSEVNGLVSSITQFLSFITFLELGIGAVVKSSLYKPLAEKNNEEISKVIISAKCFFHKISFIMIALVAILSIMYPRLVDNSFSPIYSGTLVIIISVSSFFQYYFGLAYQLLLNADQKSYIPMIVQSISLFANTILSVILMELGASIHIVKLGTAGIYTIQPIIYVLYVRKKYNLNEKLILTEEPIKQKWNGVAHHISYVITNNTDVIVLTIFSSLSSVSVYSVYHNVVLGVHSIINGIYTGITSLMGNVMYADNEADLKKAFELIEWFFHWSTVCLFTITGILIVPFVKIYTSGVNDANYIVPTFAFFITLSQAVMTIRAPYSIIIEAAGHYRQTQKSAIIETVLNVVISVVLVAFFDLVGVAVGTLVALSYRTIYYVLYLRKNILLYRISRFIKLLITDVIQVFMCLAVVIVIPLFEVKSMISWILYAIIVSCVCIIVDISINLLFYRNYLTYIFNKLMKHKDKNE